ncbi:MAG: hypothetical protein JWN25_2689 [Verrucomicrobiales bacterium]|nr:hypothetical protein [Verrucomicrobiales bacterium]
MIQFLNIAMAAGVVAASIPIIVHLAHRKKTKVVEWGAMRFLEELVAKSRRKLLLNELLLLLFRTLLLLFLAIALTRPLWNSAPKNANTSALPTNGRKAAVVLIDDSASSGYGRSFSTLEGMKTLLSAYVDTLKKGDEVSLIKLSDLGSTPEDPLFDLESLRENIRTLQPSSVHSDLSRLVDAGLNQFSRHVNPSKELIIVMDGMADEDLTDEKLRALQTKLKNHQSTYGTRLRVLVPKAGEEPVNVGIKELFTDQVLLPVDQSVSIHVKVFGVGFKETRKMSVVLESDGSLVGEQEIIARDGEVSVTFTNIFKSAGSHVLKAGLKGNSDFFPKDDIRESIAEVVQSIPVLLIENPASFSAKEPSFIASALESSQHSNSLYHVTHVSASDVTDAMFWQNRAIILNDVPAIDSLLVAALDRFVVSGGGLLVALGPHTRPTIVNEYWARGGEGFLAASIGEKANPTNSLHVGSINSGHPLFATMASTGGDPFKSISIREYFKPDKISPDSEILIALENGDPLLLSRRRNLGTIMQFNSSLDVSWNDFPVHSVFVPLVRGIGEKISNYILPGHNLEAGTQIIITPQKGLDAGPTRLLAPSGQQVPLKPTQWEGKIAFISEPCLNTGAYLSTQPEQQERYAVSLNYREGLFQRGTREKWDETFRGLDWKWVSTGAELNLPAAAEDTTRELWKACVVLAICFLIGESFLTRQHAIDQQSVLLTSAL